jgi:histidine triad (HIT) family protein
MPSLFTKIINREIPAKIAYEDNTFIVIHDINPKAPVHLLIIPKEEIATVDDFERNHSKMIAEMFFLAQKLAQEFTVAGYKLQFNVHEKGGQEIMHVHLHFLGYK